MAAAHSPSLLCTAEPSLWQPELHRDRHCHALQSDCAGPALPRHRCTVVPSPYRALPGAAEIDGCDVGAAAVEQLLSACPQLLRLKCVVKSWDVALLAAHHCARLMQLTARITEPQEISDAEVSGPQSIARPFLPQLLALQLVSELTLPDLPSQPSVLRHFARPPHARLQFVRVISPELTAQHVLSLSSLPRLCRLEAQALPHRRRAGRSD